MRGRKPKPPELTVVTGNPGRRPPKTAPKAAGALNAPPDWLTTKQKIAWRYAIKHAPLELLRRIDRGVLTAYIVAESMHREASEKVATLGMLVRSPVKGDPMQSPYLPIVNRQAEIMMRCSEQLGFTPVSRARLAVPNGDTPPKDNAGSGGKSADRFFG